MQKEFFSDGIASIHWTGSLIRIDFATVQPQLKTQDGQPAAEVTTRMIMPIEGFLKALELQQNIVKQLEKKGVIKLQQPEQEAPSQDN